MPVSANGSAAAENSTTDRPVPLPVRALRVWFALESRFSPRTAERRAARMFATPPRQKRGKIVSYPGRGEATRAYSVELSDGPFRMSATTFGDGPPAMLLHGWGGSANDMLPLAWAFARAGWRAVVFDMPGHGRSPRRESSLVEFLRAMRLVAGALGNPDIIVGHSFGGAAAVFGITELGMPVRAAVLFSPAPGPAYYVDRFVRAVGLPAERTHGMVKQLVERVGRPMESLDALVAARSADVPALIVHDPRDREVSFEFAEQMRAAWRGSQLVPAPSLGHKRILRDPTMIDAAVDFARAARA
jgi:pimeloyl-ACP methyl ester carboxylesterase